MDPLKFSIQLKDEVSQGLDAIKRKLDSLKTQDIKVRLSVENKQEIEQMLKGLGGVFGGFNMQLPDFGKVIAGASEAKAAVKETASELQAVKKAEDALASATAKRAAEQSKLNNLLAADSNSAVADKVKAYVALPEEIRKRIMEINKLLASPMGQYSQSVITAVEGRMSGVRKQLDDIFGIPQSEINAFRSDFALRLRQLVQARREEIEKAKREVDDPSFQTQVINGIRMRYAGMLEGLYDKVPMGANGTPYTALRGLTQELQSLEGQYKSLTQTRASLQAEFTSLLNQSTASAISQAAAEKAVTDATNAHAEAVKRLNSLLAEQKQQQQIKTEYFNLRAEEDKLNAFFAKYTDMFKRMNYEVSNKFILGEGTPGHHPLLNLFKGNGMNADYVNGFGDFNRQIIAIGKSTEALNDIFGRTRDQVKEMFKTTSASQFEQMVETAKAYRAEYNKQNYGDENSEKYWRYIISLLERAVELRKQFEKENPGYVMPTLKQGDVFSAYNADRRLSEIEASLTQAKEAEAKASADLAAAKENLAKAQSTEANGSKEVEAARQKVKESEEAEKKATEELVKAKEALSKVEKENAAVGKKKWSEVDSMNDLISRLKYMTQLTDKLKNENLANNTGKMTDYYKNLEALGTAFNRVLGDTPKVEQSSMLEYINKVRAAYSEFLAMVESKQSVGGAFAKSSVEKFDMIKNLWEAISKTGGDQSYLTSVQNQMNSIQSVIIDSIRNLIEQINRMKQTISDDNFTAYKTRIENTAAAMDKLSEAFVKFQGVVGKDEGMKNFMTGLGEVINKIRYNLNSLGEGASNMSGDQMLKNYRRNLDKVEEGLYRLQEARGKIIEAISIGKSSGMDVTGMENFLKFLQNYENRLLKLKNDEAALAANDLGGVFGRTYKNLLSNTSDFVKQANEYQAAATKVMNVSIDMESAMTRLTGAIQSGSGRLDVKPLRDMFDELNTLYKKVNAQPNATIAAQLLGSDFAQKIGEANRLIAVQADAERNLRRYTAMMEDIIKMEGRIDMAKAVSVALNLPTDQLDAAKKRIGDMFDEINRIVTDKTRLGDTQLFGAKQFEFKRMTADTKELTSAQEKLNRETQKAIDKSNADANKKAAAAAKEAAVETNKWAESQRQAAIQADALNRKIEKWSEIINRGSKLGVDTKDLEAAVIRMQQYLAILNQMSQGGKWSMTTSQYVSQAGFVIDERSAQAAANAVKKESDELERNSNTKKKASTASNELTLQEQRLAAEMEKVAQSAKGQSQMLSDLKSMAMQYLSVYGAQQFINNIIEIGGQLENQRMSIASILGDAAQANTLFEQIQSLAVKSPFGVVELDQYTKQLSAFGFQYNELYDMTKRLADISAGAGTDVGRLALALGHVRAEGALTGYTLRQFAMNNIPMLQKLSDMLSAREGRLVSTQDIRKRVSQKQIGYEDVISVIKGLTNKGGMFYNMQEAISQSTKSKWKNLKDAMDIMYGKMAESDFVGGGLKDLATVLTDLTKKWERIGAILITTGSTWGIAKMAAMAYNSAIGANAAQTLKAMKIAQMHDAATLSVAKSYRTLTAAEQANTTSRRSAIITTTQLAISNKRLSAEELSRAVALGKLTKQQAFCAISQSSLTIGQKRIYAEMIKGTVVLNAWQAGVLRLRIAFEGLKASFLAFATNPMTWILTAVTALTYLWSKHNEQLERAKELQDSINTTGREGVKNVKDFVNSNVGTKIVDEKTGANLTDNYEKYGNTRLQLPVFASLDQASVKSVMDNAEQFIKEYSATPNAMLNDAFAAHGDKVNNLRAQYDSLEKSLNTLHKAYAILNKDFREVMDFSMGETGGWFNDDLIENINDYSKAYSEYKNNIAKFANDHEDATNKALRAALGVKSFGDAVRATNEELKKSGSPALSNAQMLQMLLDNTKKYAEAEKAFRANVGFSGRWDWGNLTKDKANERNRWQDMENDLDTAISSMKTKLKALGWDFKNLTEAQKQALAIALAEMVGKATDSTDEVRDRIVALAKEKVGIQIDVEQAEAVAKLNEVKKQLEALCNKTWMIEVGITGDLETDLPKVDPKYQKSLEDIKRYGEALRSAGIIGKVGERAPLVVVDKKPSSLSTKWNPKYKPISNTSPFTPADTELINAYNSALDAKESALKWYDTFHLTPPEDKKGGKNGNKAYKDEFAKRWDERIRIMKEAYDWYEKWRKEYGKDTAFDKVNSRYQDIFKEWRTDKILPMDFDVKQVADYAKYVRQIKDDALKRYQTQKNDKSKNNGQEALRVFRQAVSLLTDFDWDEIQRRTEEYASTVKRTIDDMSQRWESYKNVLESTGNAGLAAQVAGLSLGDVNDVNMANNLRRYIATNMSGNVDFGRVFGMSEQDIQNYVAEELVGTPVQTEGESDAQYKQRLESYKEKVRGIVEALKEWQTLQRNVLKDAASTYAKVIGSAQDFATLTRKNNSEYAENKKALDLLKERGKISQEQYDKAIEMTAAKRDYSNGQLSGTYLNLMENSTAMTKDVFDNAMANQLRNLNKMFETGQISVENYTKELEKLRKIQKEYDDNGIFGTVSGLSALVSGGLPGLKAYYEKKRSERQTELETKGIGQDGFSKDAEWSKYDKWVNKLDKLADSASDAAACFDVVTGALDGFQKAAQSLSDMFDATGNKGAANTFSDIADGIGAVSSIFKPVQNVLQNAMSGNVGGLVSSLISAPFEMIASPITGFAKLHDKGLERKIQELKEEVVKINNNTALIVALRQRELGYDSGNLRREMARQYDPTYSGGRSNNAMYEYYTRGGLAGSGYTQELKNLQAERNNYMSQLDSQLKKKKKSDADIEETKKKIAELDEQIYYFSQDLAKELWGIDFKSWGQQLSDALATAFENGSSMAEAFDDTVRNILQDLASKMLNLGFIEPMFSQLRTDLFGQKNTDGTYSGGVIDLNNMQGSAQRVTDYIADFFGTNGEGQKALTLAQQMLDSFERGLNDAGLSIFNSDLETLSNAMQGTTEETSNLLAGYVNALRQDVSVNRILLTQFTTEYWNSYIQQVTSMQGSLSNIDRNIALIYGLMSENGALYSIIDEMNTRLRKFSTGVEKVYIN